MSNFAFVYQALPELYQDCAKAEGYLVTDAPTACFYARRAIEGLVEHIYRARGIYRPEQATLATLTSNEAFSVYLDNDKRLKFKTIRHLGNDAAHNSRKVLSGRDAERAVTDLYHLMVWGVYNHSATPALAPMGRAFDRQLIPTLRRQAEQRALTQQRMAEAELALSFMRKKLRSVTHLLDKGQKKQSSQKFLTQLDFNTPSNESYSVA